MSIVAYIRITLSLLLLAFPLFFLLRVMRSFSARGRKVVWQARQSKKATRHLKAYILKQIQKRRVKIEETDKDDDELILHTDTVIAHHKLQHFVQRILSSATDLKEK